MILISLRYRPPRQALRSDRGYPVFDLRWFSKSPSQPSRLADDLDRLGRFGAGAVGAVAEDRFHFIGVGGQFFAFLAERAEEGVDLGEEILLCFAVAHAARAVAIGQ